jgi:hypothetical protein
LSRTERFYATALSLFVPPGRGGGGRDLTQNSSDD